VSERPYRFVRGPWHNETHEMDGRREWLVPMPEPLTVSIAAMDDATAFDRGPGIKVAVYERQGDYPAEWFYRFRAIERR
jgi:hypothetical protein